MNSTKLAVNWFCATQAEEKLNRDQCTSSEIDKQKAKQNHLDVCKKVRQTIAELAGSVLEESSCPEIPDNLGPQCGAVIAENRNADLN